MLARSLELIDAKRAALKLPAYDPSQFGASGDTLYFEAIRAYLAEHDAPETVGQPRLPPRRRRRHGHGTTRRAGRDTHSAGATTATAGEEA